MVPAKNMRTVLILVREVYIGAIYIVDGHLEASMKSLR